MQRLVARALTLQFRTEWARTCVNCFSNRQANHFLALIATNLAREA
jgi:hypothetical protein